MFTVRPAWLAAAILFLAPATRGAPPAVAPDPSAPHSPTLFLPNHKDSITIDSEPAPFLQPGRPAPVDSTIKTPGELAREQLTLGIVMERQGNFPAAMLAYTNAAKFDPAIKEASFRRGVLELKWGRTADAERAFREELRRNPGHVGASQELALLLSQQGKHDDAIARVKPLTVRDPQRDEAWYTLGVVYENAGRHGDAATALRRAASLPPDRAAEHRDLGVVLAKMGKTREAHAQYQAAIALDPGDPSVWLDLGNLHARAGRPDSALAAYRRATHIDSTYSFAYQAEINTLTELKRYDEVADVYLRWVTVQPNDFDLRLRAVRHLAQIGRRDRALEIARDGVRQHPDSAAAHLILGMALDAYGSSREALHELRAAESRFVSKRDRDRVRALIATMRAAAPDSLRELFAADSVAHAASAR